jgi:hypothetical protein
MTIGSDSNKQNALVKANDNQVLIAIDTSFAVTPNIEFGRYNVTRNIIWIQDYALNETWKESDKVHGLFYKKPRDYQDVQRTTR